MEVHAHNARPSRESVLLAQHGLRSAALFYWNLNEPMMRRAGRVTRAYLEEIPLPVVTDSPLYPIGGWAMALPGDDPDGLGLRVSRDGHPVYDDQAFTAFVQRQGDPFERTLLERVAHDARTYAQPQGPSRYLKPLRMGEGDHYVPHWARILRDGLSGYRASVRTGRATATRPEDVGFYDGLLDTLDGLESLVARCVAHVRAHANGASCADARRAADALARAPVDPARTFHEALEALHFLTYFTSHEPGRLDQILLPYYQADRANGRITRDEARDLLATFFVNIDEGFGALGVGAHLTLGGSDAERRSAYSELTDLCLEAAEGRRKPTISLLARDDMPQRVWDASLRLIASGTGNPAFKDDQRYRASLGRVLGVADDAVAHYAFCGCSETTVPGESAADATWMVFNPLMILEQSLRVRLPGAEDFDAFLRGYREDLLASVREAVAHVNLQQEFRTLFTTNPLRTIFTDDCIARGLGYYAGGARYNLHVVNVLGLTDAVNALAAARRVMAGELGLTRAELLNLLDGDFQGHDVARLRLRRVEKFGNNREETDALAEDLGGLIFREFGRHRCRRGDGVFLPSIIGFVSFEAAGQYVGAMPDGRRQGAPLADSVGPAAGTDAHGITAALASAARVPQADAVGTCVMNVMLHPNCFYGDGARAVQDLVGAYFAAGGMQIQFSVVAPDVLRAAMQDPDQYRGLIVRVGGFNGRFVDMSRPIQEQILDRTVHSTSAR
jgi:formate C-acetyltransferase